MTCDRSLILTRRVALTLLGGAVPGVSLARSGLISEPAPALFDPEADLRTRISSMTLPFAPAQLDLLELTCDDQAGQHQLQALVRLTWRPGLRQQYFSAAAPDLETAVSALARTIYQGMAAAGGRASGPYSIV